MISGHIQLEVHELETICLFVILPFNTYTSHNIDRDNNYYQLICCQGVLVIISHADRNITQFRFQPC